MHSISRRIAVLVTATLAFGLQVVAITPTHAATEPGTATSIAAGGYQGCAITPNERLKCWGDNDYGQLGIGSNLSDDQYKPVLVPNLDNVKKVDVGDYNTCAILKGGKLKCWGYNDEGEVGDGTTQQRNKPTQVKGLTSGVEEVSVGTYHSCALLTNGKAKCWGYNSEGELGDGTKKDRHKPTLVQGLDNVSQISAGYYFTCATVNSKAKCWGYNEYGKLGNGSTDGSKKPVQVFGLDHGVKRVVAGYYQACAIVSGGKLKCWGYNYYGEIGTGSTGGEYHKPQNVIGLESGVTDVDTDYYFTCAVHNNKAKCWGYNYYNELGNGDATDRDVATQVSGLTKNVVGIDIAWYHGCARLKSGAEKCWGWNGEGEVGINDSTNDQIPTPKRVLL